MRTGLEFTVYELRRVALLMDHDHPVFMLHGECWRWDPSLVWPYVAASSIIAAAYFVIPVGLLIIHRKLRARRGQPYSNLLLVWLWAFAVFIVACGTGHVMDVVTTLWTPAYRLQIVGTWVTALASVAVALGFVFNLGRIVSRLEEVRDRDATKSAIRREVLSEIAAMKAEEDAQRG